MRIGYYYILSKMLTDPPPLPGRRGTRRTAAAGKEGNKE
jgi:hypothetical protein